MSQPFRRALVRAGLLHGYYIRRGGLTLDAKINVRFVFDKWSGARDLNPGPHGPEPVQWRVLSCPVVSARFLLYSKWIFFVSSCDLVYPPSSVNA